MPEPKPDIHEFQTEAGQLCLDFVNTADWHASDQPVESLNSYADLVGWAQQAGLLAGPEAQQLLEKAAEQPGEAGLALKKAVELREAIYRIFATIAAGHSPEGVDLALVNDILPEAFGRLRITETEAGFAWDWVVPEAELERMLWPIVRSAANLLTTGALGRVKQCEDDRGCGFLFRFESKPQPPLV
jgi:predicted RNA-binding Zn ribbon-like protein